MVFRLSVEVIPGGLGQQWDGMSLPLMKRTPVTATGPRFPSCLRERSNGHAIRPSLLDQLAPCLRGTRTGNARNARSAGTTRRSRSQRHRDRQRRACLRLDRAERHSKSQCKGRPGRAASRWHQTHRVMLTGDNPSAAASVAVAVGVDREVGPFIGTVVSQHILFSRTAAVD